MENSIFFKVSLMKSLDLKIIQMQLKSKFNWNDSSLFCSETSPHPSSRNLWMRGWLGEWPGGRGWVVCGRCNIVGQCQEGTK